MHDGDRADAPGRRRPAAVAGRARPPAWPVPAGGGPEPGRSGAHLMNTDLVIHGDNLSEAWARTVVAVSGAHGMHKAFHVVTRIGDPTREDAHIREMADGI